MSVRVLRELLNGIELEVNSRRESSRVPTCMCAGTNSWIGVHAHYTNVMFTEHGLNQVAMFAHDRFDTSYLSGRPNGRDI